MSLNLERLIKFDLEVDAERRLLEDVQSEDARRFFATTFKIMSTDEFIKDTPSYPGLTDKIIRSELISAIGATLAIEGTPLDSEQIEESFRKADGNEALRRSEREADNSRAVYRFIRELAQQKRDNFVYEEGMIRQIHKYFTDGMDYPSSTPGSYRDFPTTFGFPRRQSLCRNRSEVELAMSKYVEWLNDKPQGILRGNPIVKAIMAHYYLTEIHPFGDGNGRTARAVEALVLYVNGINNYCFWSLANFWSQNKEKYLTYLGEVLETCDPWNLINWGLDGFKDELMRIKGVVLRKVKQLMLMDYTRYLVRSKMRLHPKRGLRIITVISLLVGSGRVPLRDFLSSPQIASLYRSLPMRSRDFKIMRNAGLVRVTEQAGKKLIEPNFQILEHLRYHG
jgi:fido (protein-threonine AMPylation protein)